MTLSIFRLTLCEARLYPYLPGAAALLLTCVTAPRAQAASASELSAHTVVDTAEAHISVSAVEANVFHIVVSSRDRPAPPISPFVVETKPWSGASVGHDLSGTITLQTPKANLSMDRGGVFTIRAGANNALIRRGQVSGTPEGWTVALGHGADERFYGAGNPAINVAGDLTHPSGEQVITNGATQIPFLWSTGGYGCLIANNENGISWSDTGNTLSWKVPGPYADIYLIAASGGGYEALNAYSRLTGCAPIPPRWTFGYMQSRWGYADAADVRDKWHQFRDRQIPVDAFIYDYDWFVNDWQFDPKNLPAGSMDEMKKLGLHFVGIRKPRITGANLAYATKRGWILTSPYGTDLRFDIPDARVWWWDKQAPLLQAGVDGWWNDEAEQTYDEFFQMTSLQWTGQRAINERRVWTLNRCFAPGMQRFGAAVWSGDITSSWKTLSNQPGTLLNYSLAGMPYSGQDIGGFFGPPEPELYARWIEEGVFVPVMRSHGMHDEPRWPWAFGDSVLDATKRAIELRYKLIPYLYTLAAENSRTGAPIMRPLLLEFPSDKNTVNMQDEWLLGDKLLAAPVLTKGGSRSVYLPEGTWYDFNTGASVTGGRTVALQDVPLATIPVYMRAGSILPLGPVLQYTGQGPEDPLEVRVYPGADANFSLYEDAGDDYTYLDGKSSLITFSWNDKRRRLDIKGRTGSYPGMLQTRHFKIQLPDGRSQSVVYTGRALSVRF